MSNLLKSKFLLGVMVVAALFVGVVAVQATTASAATCTITTTLRVGSKGADVKCLQAALGLTADGSFGPKTKAAVVAFQKNAGLVADGIFGAKSRAVWMANVANAGGMTYPAGCTSGTGFSSTTGQPCTGTVVTTTLPAGCTSTSGFSPTTGASCSTGAVTGQTGPVSVTLATDNPATGYIIANQATADLAHFTFTGNGTVNTVVLQRTGISDQNTLTNVYLFNGNTRLTDGYSFNNTGVLTMNNLNIAVNGMKTISVRADVASSVANASTLGITLVSFTAAGNSVTTANVAANQMTVGVGNLASISVGTNTVTGSPTVNAGTSAYTVWSAPVQVNTRAVWLKGANFRMVGSAPAGALSNIHLYVDGVSAGAVATLGTITGSNYAMFDFSAMPVSLSTGTHTVDVRADVTSGSSYTVQVSLQQASDLVVFDGQVGVNIAAITTSSTTFTSNSGAIITINAGSAAVTVDPTFQSMTNITGGATNTVIGRFKVHGYGEDVKVSTLTVTPVISSGVVASGNNTSLNNVAVFFNGSQVGSSMNFTGSALPFNLGSQMIIPAGIDSTIEIRADLQNSTSINYTGGTVSAQLTTATGNGQGQTSHTTLNFPSSNVSGTTLTIQTGVLAVSKNTGYASQNVNPNTAGVKIGSFTLQNQSSSESVRVTSLAIALTQANGSTLLTNTGSATVYPALTNFSNLRTDETSGSGANPIQPSANNTFSVNFTLAPGATKVLNVYADTSATAASAQFSTNLVITSIGSSSNVSISQNGNATAVAGQVLTLAIGTLTNAPTILSSTTTAAQYVAAAAGGASNVAKATFNIAATGGAATVSEMKFAVNSSDVSTAASAGTLTSATTGVSITVTSSVGFAAGDFVKITSSGTTAYGIVESLPDSTHVAVTITKTGTGTPATVAVVPNTVTAVTINGVSAPVVSGIAYLTGLNLAVPNGSGGLNQDVYTSYAEVSTNGLISGATSRLSLVYVKYQSGSTTGTLCTLAIATCTDTAGNTATISVGGVSAPTMTLVGSNPTFTATQPSATLAAGNIEVVDVTVTANAKGNVALNTLAVHVAPSSTVTMTTGANGIIVKDANNQTVSTTDTGFTGGAGTASTSTITFGSSGYTISGSQTFKIYVPVASVTGSGVNSSSLSTTLPSGAAAMTWTDLAGSATVAQTGSSVVTASLPTSLIPSYPSTFTSVLHN